MSSIAPSSDHLNPSGLILPAYVMLRPEGVFINMSPPPAQDILQLFMDRLFSNENRFSGLDYNVFSRLLFDADFMVALGRKAGEIRIASSIMRFPKQRMELYRGVKVSDSADRAEYIFEPVFIEMAKEEAIYGEPDEDGIMPVIDYQRTVDTYPTQLDFDEFVASVWLKGVRFGINAEAVRDAMKRNLYTSLVFAVKKDPTDSKDAQVVEESETLRQDNAPMILANGKADLRRAKNRFPQITKNSPLLRKIPREMGKPGHRVNGSIIEPRHPLDVDMSKLAGEGTRIEQTQKGEMLVANIDGFIVFDEHTGEIYITSKIENKSGISAKSTGDLVLTVDHYTEFGEVQEGRIVEGKYLTFRSNVYGNILSQNGDIELEKNLSGGRAQSVGGNVFVKGKAINATIEACDGKVNVEFAESCIIIGKFVTIERAVNCEIIAEELNLGVSEGCAIAGKKILITTSTTRKNRETIISMLLPDIVSYDKQIAEIAKVLAQIDLTLQAKNRELAASQTDPGFAKYLAISEKLRSGAIKFSAEQEVGWQKIVNQYAPLYRGLEGLLKKRQALDDATQHLKRERTACCNVKEHCKIQTIQGDTLVRKQITNLGILSYKDMQQSELKGKLNEMGAMADRIFSSSKGSLDWQYQAPEAS